MRPQPSRQIRQKNPKASERARATATMPWDYRMFVSWSYCLSWMKSAIKRPMKLMQ